ncbi:hypothetical protein B0H10DRAFT_1777423 [Mycena sp. CBHHK59/15]|nr:hypothetical protein B0H10DRAFT_1777423 [Mycena sp. CBHHK59/15]
MFSSFALAAAFVASVSAIAVTSPGTSHNWTNSGITWTSVSTDPSNFTIVLTNTNRALMPTNNQILKALVLTSALTTTVDPPSEGWPSVGGSYRVNFCKDSEDLSSILAQSDEFNITAAPAESGSANGASASKTTTPIAVTGSTGSGASNTDAAASSTDSAATPSGSSAALPAMSMHTGFAGLLLLLGAFLA